ncbi:MAG TPA: hypothetical protein VM900_06320 [Sphingomonas sp.]|jgi:hypothetical protein|nr:hypothetical protein [Sphingomonas sp.]
MIAPLLLALLQAAPAPAEPQRWSILTPTDANCNKRNTDRGEILVCAPVPGDQRLPLPDYVEPGATPNGVNPKMNGAGALAAEGTPCAAMQRGCLVGVGPPIVPIVKAAADLVKSAFAKKPDKRGRVPIPLD